MFWDIWKYGQVDGFLPKCVKHRNGMKTGEESAAFGKNCWGKTVYFPPRQLVMGWEIPVRTGTKLTIRAWKWPWPSNRGDYHGPSDFTLMVCSETLWYKYINSHSMLFQAFLVASRNPSSFISSTGSNEVRFHFNTGGKQDLGSYFKIIQFPLPWALWWLPWRKTPSSVQSKFPVFSAG